MKCLTITDHKRAFMSTLNKLLRLIEPKYTIVVTYFFYMCTKLDFVAFLCTLLPFYPSRVNKMMGEMVTKYEKNPKN